MEQIYLGKKEEDFFLDCFNEYRLSTIAIPFRIRSTTPSINPKNSIEKLYEEEKFRDISHLLEKHNIFYSEVISTLEKMVTITDSKRKLENPIYKSIFIVEQNYSRQCYYIYMKNKKGLEINKENINISGNMAEYINDFELNVLHKNWDVSYIAIQTIFKVIIKDFLSISLLEEVTISDLKKRINKESAIEIEQYHKEIINIEMNKLIKLDNIRNNNTVAHESDVPVVDTSKDLEVFVSSINTISTIFSRINQRQ